MKFRDLNIQTQREAPNNARTEGFSFVFTISLATRSELHPQNLLLALAETYHDPKGLTLPHPTAPAETV